MAKTSVSDSGCAGVHCEQTVRSGGGGDSGGGGVGSGTVMTKAMLRRQKKETEEREREVRINDEKSNMGPSARDREEAALKLLLTPLHLRIKDIKADGHCMYRSVEDQLVLRNSKDGAHAHGEDGAVGEQSPEHAISDGGQGAAPPVGEDFASLRWRCAHVMRKSQWDYRPFLAQCAEDSTACNAAWVAYCLEVEDSAAWGGQMELGALAKALGRCIKVYTAHMPVVVMGEEFAVEGGEAPLVVCFQQHAFGLGEHYNSVVGL